MSIQKKPGQPSVFQKLLKCVESLIEDNAKLTVATAVLIDEVEDAHKKIDILAKACNVTFDEDSKGDENGSQSNGNEGSVETEEASA